MNTDESLSKVFDIEPMKEQEVEVLPATGEPKHTSAKIEDDYDHARDNLRELLTQGKAALETALTVAKQSEHPRAFEVVATLIKNTAEANEKLMVMQKAVRDMKNIKAKESGVNVDKAIFVGSTAELNKLLKAKKNESE